MTDELKKAIHQWIDIEYRFSLERRPDRAIDRTKVFEMSPLKEKEDLDFFLHIRIGDYSFCATVGSDGAFHGFWNTIPDESHIHYNHYYELLYVVDGPFQYDMLQQSALLHTGEAMIMDTHCIYWDKKIDSDSVVLCFAISIPFFTRLFLEDTGMTPYQFRKEQILPSV